MEIEREVKKMTLGHDFGAGAACLKCKDKCEGFELHFWRKICRNCKCGLAEHDVQMISEENRRVGKLFEDTKYTGLIAKLKTDGIPSYKGNMVTISLSGPSTAYVVPPSGSTTVVPPPSAASAGSVQTGGAAARSGQPGGAPGVAGSGQPGGAAGVAGSWQPGGAPGVAGSGQPGGAPGVAGSVHPGGAAAGSVQQRVSAWAVPASSQGHAQPVPAGVAAVKASTVPMTVNTAAANVVPVKKDVPMHSVTYEWAPPVANTNKYMAVRYIELLPPEKRPVAGSEGAAYRRQQMACQLPEHDQDPSKCHELSPAEVKQMEQYVRKYKDEALGMGDIMLPEEMFLARAGAAGQGGVGAGPGGPGSGTRPGVGVGGGPGAMKAGGVGVGVGGAAPGGVGAVPGTGGVGGYGPGIGSAGSGVGVGYGPGAGVGAGYGPGAGAGAGYGPGAGAGAGYGPGAGAGAGYGPGAGVGAGYGPGAGAGAGYGPGAGVGAGYGPGAGAGYGPGVGAGAGYGPGAGAGYGPGVGAGAGYGPGAGAGYGPGAGAGAGYEPGVGAGEGYGPGAGGGTGAGYGQDAGGAGLAGYGQGVGGAGVGGGIGGPEIGPRDMGTATTAGAMGIPGAPQAGLPHQAFSCNHCQQPMRQGDPAVYAERAGYDKMWHPACFVCCKCSELLVDMIYFWKKGKLYCGRHYGDSEKPRCGGCDELIFSNEYTQAEDQNWHLKHFCCYDCDLILAGETYVMEKDKPICTPCYMKSYAVKCTACNNPVEPEAQRVSYGDHHWHAEPQCFQCSCCSKCLIGERFMAMQAFLFCSVECKKKTMS